MKKLLLSFLLLLATMPLWAHDFEYEDIYYNILDKTDLTVEVTYRGSSYNDYSNEYTGAIEIYSNTLLQWPTTVYSVTTIGKEAFKDCSGLTSITIPNSVTSIGEEAFYDCSGLTSITIPSSVTSIGDGAFNGCSGLTSITIPNSVTSIGADAFNGCSGLTSITIPNSVTSIGADAFKGCSGLTSITIPNSVTSIGYGAFKGCSGLTSITIPNSVTSIGDGAFYGCSGLTSITIPNSVTSIGDGAFYDTGWYNNQPDGILYLDNCCLGYKGTKSTGALSLKGGTRLISDYAFYGCSNLTSVTIPNSVTTIGDYVFCDCTSLASATIPNSVTSIGDGAFNGCKGLTSVTIPNSITSIGNYAFYRCSNLKIVVNFSKLTFSKGSSNYGYIAYYADRVINAPNGAIDGDFVFCKENNVNKLVAYLGNANELILPPYVNGESYVIGLKAFYGCSSLTSVTIPNSVTSIGDYAFSDCTGLTSATIGNSVATIGDYAFRDCTGLTSVTIGNSVTSIGDGAFFGCTGLTSVTIPNSVTKIGSGTFYGCSGLTSITIPNSVTSIGSGAFLNCTGLNIIVSFNPTPPNCYNSNSFSSSNYSKATLYVPKDSFAKYYVDDVWGLFSNITKIETLVSSIKLNSSSIELVKGSTTVLSASISPSNATIKDIVWESRNPQVAMVDQSGKVTALSAGTATITAKTIDGSGKTTSCEITVVAAKITLSQTEANLPVNDIMTLTYNITPSNTPVEWSTSNLNVAYIKKNSDNSVTVVGMAEGEAIITAKATDGSGASASCKVIVGVGGVEGVEIDDNAVEVARYDIHGRLLSEPTKGINIIKMSDGSTRKEIVK